MSTLDAIQTPEFRQALEARLIQGVSALWANNEIREASIFDHSQAITELLNLSKGHDCHYDVRTIGAHYAVWYQARRINDAARALLPLLEEHDDDISILDLGAGTGAAWFAVDAIERARRELGRAPRDVSIHAIDSSPVMLRDARTIWDATGTLPSISVTTQVSGWMEPVRGLTQPIVLASYLLDHSDRQRVAAIADGLVRVFEHHRATRAAVISAPNKVDMTQKIVNDLTSTGAPWHVDHQGDPPGRLWTGELPELGQLRADIATKLPDDIRKRMARGSPSWSGGRPSTVVSLTRDPYDDLDVDRRPAIVLDRAQAVASEPDGRLTAIIGVAGSGKSRVLVERLVRTLEQDVQSRRASSTLVTTFNKQLLSQLFSWFNDGVKSSPILNSLSFEIEDPADTEDFRTRIGQGSGYRIRVRMLNYDKVPTRLFGVRSADISSESDAAIRAMMNFWLRKGPADRREWAESRQWLTPKFIMSELRRVVFGLGALTEADYLAVERRGRGHSPRLTELDRRMLWSLMMGDRKNVRLFVDSRVEVVRRLRDNRAPLEVFDRVFIDEAQDFLPIEFTEVLPSLVNDPGGVVVAADATQAMHTGASFDPPWGHRVHRRDGERYRVWNLHSLVGSYRLPIWVADAVRPLAKHITEIRRPTPQAEREPQGEVPAEEVAEPQSMRNSVLGVRPIIAAVDSLDDLAHIVASAIDRFGSLLRYDNELSITWAEAPAQAAEELIKRIAEVNPGARVAALAESMASIKGLERPVVLWRSADEAFRLPNLSTPELLYTAFTRTTCLLIINLEPDTSDLVRRVVTRLDRKHLLFWDELAMNTFDSWSRDLRQT